MESETINQKAEHPQLKPLVLLAGTAKQGNDGPSLGVVDIGVGEDAFIFRVSLPGIRKNESNLKCEIRHDGTVHIHGVVTSAEGILKDSSSDFQTRVEQLNPAGPFGISFTLPGPVDPRLFSPNFRTDGILEGVVMRYKIASNPKDCDVPPS